MVRRGCPARVALGINPNFKEFPPLACRHIHNISRLWLQHSQGQAQRLDTTKVLLLRSTFPCASNTTVNSILVLGGSIQPQSHSASFFSG